MVPAKLMSISPPGPCPFFRKSVSKFPIKFVQLTPPKTLHPPLPYSITHTPTHTPAPNSVVYLSKMFFLSEIEHRLRLPPKLLDRPLEDAIKGELESIFLDKVIAKTGLCVSIYDIKSIDGGFVLPADGAPTYTVVFRMVMFRPYVGEIIAAKLKNSNKKGLQLSLGFFDDIYIPAFALPDPSHIEPHDDDPKQVKWVWTYNELELSYDDESVIRFQVTSVDYPPIPLEQEEGSKPFAPMVVTGLLSSDGLGPISWWV